MRFMRPKGVKEQKKGLGKKSLEHTKWFVGNDQCHIQIDRSWYIYNCMQKFLIL
jgi:hypothetical protein